MSKSIYIPTYLVQNFYKFGLDIDHVGVVMVLEAGKERMTFDEMIYLGTLQGPIEERKNEFELRRMIKDLERKELVHITKTKYSYLVEWLPKSFGE